MARSRKSKSATPKKSRRSRKASKSGSRKRKLSPGAKKWHKHLMSVYKGSGLSLGEAMRKASKTYKP